jgi:hypothetical protein
VATMTRYFSNRGKLGKAGVTAPEVARGQTTDAYLDSIQKQDTVVCNILKKTE